MDNERNPNQERIQKLVEKVHEAMEDIGLYSLNYSVGTSDPALIAEDGQMDVDVHKLIEDGEASFVLSGAFAVNQMAWSARILYPEQFDLDRQFSKMMPSEAEMELVRMKNKIEKSGDILAIFDDDDDEVSDGD